MKHIDLKISFYIRKFGLGISLLKMPVTSLYAYKLTIQITWIECCLFLYLKSKSWNK